MAIKYEPRKKTGSQNTITFLQNLAEQPSSPAIAIERAAARIASEMKKIHGGDWHVLTDHQRRLLMVWSGD